MTSITVLDTENAPLHLCREHLIVVAIMLFAAVVVIARLHRLEIALERDEGEYAFIAQLLLDGVPPYLEANTMKLPGVPLLYAPFLLAFGESARAVHVAGLCADLVMAVAAALFFQRAVAAERGRLGAVVTGCVAFVLASLPCFDGFAANCEKFVSMFVAIGFVQLVRARTTTALLLAGLAMGAAFLCKQQVLVHLVLVCVLAFFKKPIGGEVETSLYLRHRLHASLVVGVGILLPFAALLVAMKLAGVFEAFWFQTVSYASEYVSTSSHPREFFVKAITKLAGQPLVWWSVVGVASFMWSPRVRGWSRATLMVWCIASVGALSIGLQFRPHYFVFLVTPLAIAGAHLAVRFRLAGVLLGVVLLVTIGLNRGPFFLKTDKQVVEQHYGLRHFTDAETVASILRESTPRGERILIIGSEPEILFLADRRSVTPYIYFYPLLEKQLYAHDQQRQVIKAAKKGPRHVVVSISTLRNVLSARSSPLKTWTIKFLEKYEVVWPPDGPKAVTIETLPSLQPTVYLLRRKGR